MKKCTQLACLRKRMYLSSCASHMITTASPVDSLWWYLDQFKFPMPSACPHWYDHAACYHQHIQFIKLDVSMLLIVRTWPAHLRRRHLLHERLQRYQHTHIEDLCCNATHHCWPYLTATHTALYAPSRPSYCFNCFTSVFTRSPLLKVRTSIRTQCAFVQSATSKHQAL